MSGQRPALRGQGYQVKGGAHATRAHNDRAREDAAAAALVDQVSAEQPQTAEDGRTDAPAARSAASRSARMPAGHWPTVGVAAVTLTPVGTFLVWVFGR